MADKGGALCPMELPLGINSHDHLSCPTWVVSNGASNEWGHTVNRLHQPYLRSPYVTERSWLGRVASGLQGPKICLGVVESDIIPRVIPYFQEDVTMLL